MESAIVAVRDALPRYHGGRDVLEASAKNESQTNGAVEEAGKTIRDFVIVLKDQIEDKADMTINSDGVISLWMVRWAAMMVSRFLVGKDGRTAYERRRGRRCKVAVIPFGKSLVQRDSGNQESQE